jgi:predicted dehydrogenase
LSKKLRLGVIGAGSWAVVSHLPNFAQRAEEVEFVAVCRKGRELLEKVKTDWGFSIASEDYVDVIQAGIDICLVASPPLFHHAHAKAALQAGAHVLIEKPFTIDPEDAWDLVATAHACDRHVVVSYGWNYLPIVREAKRLMTEPGIGEVETVAITMASQCRELFGPAASYPGADLAIRPERETWTDPAVSGGGYGQAQLTHALGLALWLTGLRATEVFSLMWKGEASVEFHDAVTIRYEGGAIGTMYGGSTHAGAGGVREPLEVRAIGSEGQIHLDLERARLWLYRGEDDDRELPFEPGDGVYNCDGPPHTLVDLALGNEAANCSPGELGARTVELLAAAYRSANTGALERVSVGRSS